MADFSSAVRFAPESPKEADQNLDRFEVALALLPAERQHRVRFEDLLEAPVTVLEETCAFLGIDFHPDMAFPYEKQEARMTDGRAAWGRCPPDVWRS